MPKKKGDCFLCGKTSNNRCEKCYLVYYCSRDHYLCHHQKEYCFPYRITWKSMGGGPEAIVATRDIRPLELVLFEEALAWGPSYGKSWSPDNSVCTECLLSKDKLIECGLCGLPVCDDLCQVGLNHNIECKILRAIRGTQFSKEDNGTMIREAILPLRLLQAKTTNSKVFSRSQFLVQVKHPSQNNQINIDESSWLPRRKKLVRFLHSTFGCGPDQLETIMWAVDISKTRPVQISGSVPSGGHKIGSAFFPIFSLVTQSCSPNAKFSVYHQHNTVSLQSQTSIKMGDVISISLVPTLDPTWKRRARLHRDYMFMCTCQRCQDPTELGSYLSALRCQKCQGQNGPTNCLTPIDPLDAESDWTCRIHSKTRVSGKGAFELVKDLQARFYSKGLITTLGKIEECLAEMECYLHPNHALLMMAKRYLLQCYSQLPAEKAGLSEQTRMKDLCLNQLDVLGKVDPGFPEWKGDILKHLSSAELNLARIRMESGLIQRPEFLVYVRKAMSLVQEGLKCKSCIKIDRSSGPATLEDMVSELSDSSYMSDASIHM